MKERAFLFGSLSLVTFVTALLLVIVAIQQLNPYFAFAVESFGLTETCEISSGGKFATIKS